METSTTSRRGQDAPQPGGRARALEAALEGTERQPALTAARERAIDLIARSAPPHEVTAAVEADVGLTCAVVRAAAQIEEQGGLGSVSEAVHRLGPSAVEAAVRSTPSYDPFTAREDGFRSDRARVHALSVQRAADHVAEAIGWRDRAELSLAATLHDIGRSSMERMYPGYAQRFGRHRGTPDDRVAAERRELGIDHAQVGGVLVRTRWGLKAQIAMAIEQHHNRDAEGMAGVIRTADMITAYLDGAPVDPDAMREAAETCELGAEGLRDVLYELPQGKSGRPRGTVPCPLSERELEVIRGLADGKVYKQIAHDLGVSASTVRTHVHNAYAKLGVVDRVQAVLMATKQGWI